VIIVSGVGQTRRDAALETRKQITRLGGRILGVVANFAEPQHRGGYYYSSRQPTAPAASR
jgi:Mrp family chromosome partitioning ATPase